MFMPDIFGSIVGLGGWVGVGAAVAALPQAATSKVNTVMREKKGKRFMYGSVSYFFEMALIPGLSLKFFGLSEIRSV
jgi:hypothetical protein